MKTQKQNVSQFNSDVAANQGYIYTTNARFSSVVSNRRMTEATLAAIPKGAKTLIDIGCGDGTYTAAIKAARPDLACTGFDPATVAIESARRRFPDVEYISGDLLDPSQTPARKYDVGVVRGVIHHLPDAKAGIANALRLSDTIILVEPNGDNPILKWLERNSRYHIEHEEQSFSAVQLQSWCREAGGTVRSIGHIGFVPMFFPAPLARLIYFLQPMFEMIGPLKRKLGAQIVIVYGR